MIKPSAGTILGIMLLAANVLLVPAYAKDADSPVAEQLLPRPARIYVAPFQLDPELVKTHGISSLFHGDERAEKAQKLTQLLAQTIVDELQKGGQGAQIAQDAGVMSPRSWLVSGYFVKADTGRRLVSSLIGFGAGAESVGIEVEVRDANADALLPILSFSSTSGGIRRFLPGGLVTKSPYMAGTKFLLSRNATESDVKKQGVDIAKNLLSCMVPASSGG